ncbi:uncharacterized protein [Euwallacea similis]|uniref:uncharacterized protein n=1 Tax=Euwallacea similis TaxID=1736056 RepID=UPI00344BB2D7
MSKKAQKPKVYEKLNLMELYKSTTDSGEQNHLDCNVIEIFDPETQTLIKSSPEELKKSFYEAKDKSSINVVYKVIYPDDLNLKHPPLQKSKKPLGRPKKLKTYEPVLSESSVQSDKGKVKVVSKTRSGREVKVPKYIQDEFKIVIEDRPPSSLNDFDNKTGSNTDKSHHYRDPVIRNMKSEEQPDFLQKKRRIAAQYRCPKCKKAYLGRNKMLEHLRKNPSHGPIDQNKENHFEVWNHLVSITQKCALSERGAKFCQELSNLLHNLLLLTNALFKKLGSAVNEVDVDKVLGNAIGLNPGTYYFDDTNLYKDVSLLKLMGNTDFVNSIKSTMKDISSRSGSNCNCAKLNLIDELVLNSMLISSEANNAIAKKIDDIRIEQSRQEEGDTRDCASSQHFTGEEFLVSSTETLSTYDCDMTSAIDDQPQFEHALNHKKSNSQPQSLEYKSDVDMKRAYFSSDIAESFAIAYQSNNSSEDQVKSKEKASKIKIHANIMLCPPKPKYLQSSIKPFVEDTSPAQESKGEQVNPDLLIENSVLSPIGNLRHSVDELMLPVPVASGPTSILDTSSSSDEVMNVDHFVNERFRRITESDLEGHSNNSLNLDLPVLDLFQFHTT